MNEHEHELTILGTYSQPSTSRATVTYRVEWCETCKEAYQIAIAFLDLSKKRTPDELRAAIADSRANRQALLSTVHRLRAGESIASVLADKRAAQ